MPTCWIAQTIVTLSLERQQRGRVTDSMCEHRLYDRNLWAYHVRAKSELMYALPNCCDKLFNSVCFGNYSPFAWQLWKYMKRTLNTIWIVRHPSSYIILHICLSLTSIFGWSFHVCSWVRWLRWDPVMHLWILNCVIVVSRNGILPVRFQTNACTKTVVSTLFRPFATNSVGIGIRILNLSFRYVCMWNCLLK